MRNGKWTARRRSNQRLARAVSFDGAEGLRSSEKILHTFRGYAREIPGGARLYRESEIRPLPEESKMLTFCSVWRRSGVQSQNLKHTQGATYVPKVLSDVSLRLFNLSTTFVPAGTTSHQCRREQNQSCS